jgi:hypothetical protein
MISSELTFRIGLLLFLWIGILAISMKNRY